MTTPAQDRASRTVAALNTLHAHERQEPALPYDEELATPTQRDAWFAWHDRCKLLRAHYAATVGRLWTALGLPVGLLGRPHPFTVATIADAVITGDYDPARLVWNDRPPYQVGAYDTGGSEAWRARVPAFTRRPAADDDEEEDR